ncbi:UDP-3-O-(3-hydroxymyristoyl)glucosamine N-acyltransferase [Psychrobacter sp. AOP22-C1-22]|uniref:UDP-3-O-(3-hydroxymyristoyl)glucosamine N-acyltransferase n=1 Tax=unclassified Psychrobacter TaxID=196806 RepID=UPI0017882308|nr:MULTISPECIES: UDP-3-O-(3-hydroxymyristoyl)glucosamine N-acyltransferase [unclassified Psychrobacter]MBE0406247.1 UDP-3-O-(3-hydroxymyristoyl)glucosamine N-acyltransferase [Psychrobacter sp. FME6]MBE0444626.1 UDP-3-O-(3-hydroxymyristoyl)glucosamine N-acyltransferase [Psychrobacter sp. FME5]MDN5801113.1 UDP-3-O-(3-hydroxymyristoyl)glucosamine N-acyltransferase [Psychrobacter sp.]
MITIEQLITRIEQRQPITNKAEINAEQSRQKFSSVGSLTTADSKQLSFLADPHYVSSLANSRAGAVLVTAEYRDQVPATALALVVASPYLAYASASQLFAHESPANAIHPSAVIADSAVIGEQVTVGAFCVIGDNVQIGARSSLDAHVVIEANTKIGHDCIIKSQVVIGHDCIIGNHVRLHAGVSVGAEGFGFAPTSNPSVTGWERIAQLGRVIIGDHVRIGSHTCIDRGAIDDTLIGNHVIIDNLVQVAHNVRIGDGTAIAAQTGIAGSTSIGKRCIIGGAVGITGHIDITDDVTLSGMSMVTKSIKNSGSYSSGTVAMPTANWRRAAVRFRQLGRG